MTSTKSEIAFNKYETRRKDYHWLQVSNNIFQRNAFVVARYKNMLSLLRQTLNRQKQLEVLDLGCGDGVLSYFLYKEGHKVSGIDYSEIAIEAAKERLAKTDIKFKQGTAYNLPYPNNNYDAILSTEVIEHLQDIPQYLLEIKRCLKLEGIFIISTPIRITKEPLDTNHVIEWFPDEFKKLIDAHFPNTKYKQSHPVALTELLAYQVLKQSIFKWSLNILSFIKNPFEGFNSKFRYNAIQYAIGKK